MADTTIRVPKSLTAKLKALKKRRGDSLAKVIERKIAKQTFPEDKKIKKRIREVLKKK